MGRENTIRTGSTISKRLIRPGANNAFLMDKTLPSSPYEFGRVQFVDSNSWEITYQPLEDNLLFNKQGQALPLNRNSQKLPATGSIVPLLRAPEFSNIETSPDRTTKIIYYLDPIEVNINDNTISSEAPTTVSNRPSNPVKINSEEQKNNMVFVKNFCKSKGLSKEATAGIMGNIMKESNFNPTNGWTDVNGAASYGLIQWNGASYDLNRLGDTADTQMEALFDLNYTKNMKKYLDTVAKESNLDAWKAAYYFAKYVEICSLCNKGEDTYKKGGTVNSNSGTSYQIQPVERSSYAMDFMNKFNDPNDPLVW